MTTYRVDVTRDDKWWMIRIPELDGVNGVAEPLTQARRFEDIETEARDLICLVADVAPSTVVLDLHIDVGGMDVGEVSREIATARAEASAAERRAVERSTETARALRAAGLDLRDIGAVVGLSFQRVSQLVGKAS
ncbi:HicB-like antitoxin [Gordonia phage Agueybana]|uniref:HicB-like antitoxin n=1 Tax=Gordonia phage Agueybana TaxID=2859634 RepID=A0AC61NMH0_9CAUD|nr:HicB-like antitoxin [Gordonia phage Agueybana]QYC54593.1 HicB-like antitoxin [Gordonia phage Agueybana]